MGVAFTPRVAFTYRAWYHVPGTRYQVFTFVRNLESGILNVRGWALLTPLEPQSRFGDKLLEI